MSIARPRSSSATQHMDTQEMPPPVKDLYQAMTNSYKHFERGITLDEERRETLAMEEYEMGIAIVESTLRDMVLSPELWNWRSGLPLQWKQIMLKRTHDFGRRIRELNVQKKKMQEEAQKQKKQKRHHNTSSSQSQSAKNGQQQSLQPKVARSGPVYAPVPQQQANHSRGGWLDRFTNFIGLGSSSSSASTSASTGSSSSSSSISATDAPLQRLQQPHHYHYSQTQSQVQPLSRQHQVPRVNSQQVRTRQQQQQQQQQQQRQKQQRLKNRPNTSQSAKKVDLANIPEFRGIDRKLLNSILDEVMEQKPDVSWDDIAGLKETKQTLIETVIWPSLRPDLFSGLRKPARGILLFGPPGNGKTMLAKAVASECQATFFSISASAINSKWHGEGEKIVRALFAVARHLSPSVIFIDEVDSMLTSRSSNEHEASRRIKTEFLVQMDGVSELKQDRLLVLAATNRPDELDDAILRRFIKRVLIPMPDREARTTLLMYMLKGQNHSLSHADITRVANQTEGFSSADLHSLCSETAMAPLREIGPQQLLHIRAEEVRPMNAADFLNALKYTKPSVSEKSLADLEEWNSQYGNMV